MLYSKRTHVEDQQQLISSIEKVDELCLKYQLNQIICLLLNHPPILLPSVWKQREAAIEEFSEQQMLLTMALRNTSFVNSTTEFENF